VIYRSCLSRSAQCYSSTEAVSVNFFADRSALYICHSGFSLVGVPPQKHRLSANRRRALELLANSLDGVTKETLVLVHGIDRDTIAGLVRTGLATTRHEIVSTGSKTINGKRYRITNAGRMALEGWPAQLIQPAR
jgi:hypothetical protein